MKKTICLNMIVKNESKNLHRLFKSLHEVIDYYIIHDTGSTDGTQGLIKKIMDSYGISGEIIEEDWVNFGINRQKALDSVINSNYNPDYALWIDADEELYYKDKDYFNNLTKDCYHIKRVYGSIDYYNPHLFRVSNNNEIGWHWKGPVHNYLNNKQHYIRENVDKNLVHIKSHHHGGAKSHGVTSREKYLRDAKLLLDHLKTHPDDPRSIFYLAQSYRDTGTELEEAIKWYKKRLEVGGWVQEKYISCLKLGSLLKRVGREKEGFYYYLLSYEYDNSRYECFYHLIHHYRQKGMRKLALSLYKQLKPVDVNNNKLFLVYNIHDWKLDFELTIIPYYCKEYRIAIEAFKRLFKNESKKIPLNIVRLICKNFGYYIKYMKSDELSLVIKQKKEFEAFYFKKPLINEKEKIDISLSDNLFKTNMVQKEIKEEVKEEINLKSVDFKTTENQGIKLTVTEKIN